MITIYQEMESEMRKKLEEKKNKYRLDNVSIDIVITIGNPSDKY
jgi:hypothetical protein